MVQMIYMKISNDEYELPEIIADSISELARKCNVQYNTVQMHLMRSNKKGEVKKQKYIEVEIGD